MEPTKEDHRQATVRHTLTLSDQTPCVPGSLCMCVRRPSSDSMLFLFWYLQVGKGGHIIKDAVGKLRDFIAVEWPGGWGDQKKESFYVKLTKL